MYIVSYLFKGRDSKVYNAWPSWDKARNWSNFLFICYPRMFNSYSDISIDFRPAKMYTVITFKTNKIERKYFLSRKDAKDYLAYQILNKFDSVIKKPDFLEADQVGTINSGKIYVLVNPYMPGLVNIGVAFGDVYEKVEELTKGTGVPVTFIVAYEEYFYDCVTAEFCIKSELAAYSVADSNDFYFISMAQAVKLIQEISQNYHLKIDKRKISLISNENNNNYEVVAKYCGAVEYYPCSTYNEVISFAKALWSGGWIVTIVDNVGGNKYKIMDYHRRPWLLDIKHYHLTYNNISHLKLGEKKALEKISKRVLNKPGYVYIGVNSYIPNLLKIGMSKNPERRIKRLSRDKGVPGNFRLAFKKYFVDCEVAEFVIHMLLRDYRVNPDREFFQYPLPKAIALINSCVR